MQYIGKDILTHGSLLHLDPQIAWERLRSRAKQGIRKAKRAGVRIVESRDLAQMAKVWYNPDTLTKTLEPEQKLYLAYLGDQLIGGIIVTPVTSNTLFYHYGGTNEAGRAVEANAYLLWHVVEAFHQSPYQYLDVGVSFRDELQHYFQKYCTQPYPILFHPPADDIKPQIRLNPVAAEHLDWIEQQMIAVNTQLSEYFEAEFTYMPSWPFALQSAFRALNLPDRATIGVWASVGEQSYVAELNRLFGDCWTFAARRRDAQAYLACHRWSVFCDDVEALSTETVPLVEDCRDRLYYRANEPHAGSFGRYAVFDFARWFPMQFGAALVGDYFPDQTVWDKFHCLDITKRNTVRELLQIHWPQRMTYAGSRLVNWKRHAELFGLLGMSPVEQNPYEPPFAFLLQAQAPYTAHTVYERLLKFGIHAEMDANDDVIALPCHPGVKRSQVDYIFGAFRGMVNPCHTFVRADPSKEKS
jgi:hypothetical protein